MDGPYENGEGMMHEGMEGMEYMGFCPCNPSNVYPCHWQTPPMMSIGATMQCREYPEAPETEQLSISGRTRSGY